MGANKSKARNTKAVKEQPKETVEAIAEVESHVEAAESSRSIDRIYGDKAKVDDFQLLTVIGKGGFGKVFMVRHISTNKIYAMKVLKKDQIIETHQVDHTMAEKEVLMGTYHPFVVGLHYAFQTADKLYLVLDYVNGGELFYHLHREKSFTEMRVKFYAAELTLALAHLHANNIVYRDLKPENILVDSDGHLRVTDFGLCKHLGTGSTTTTLCGTPEYVAPEILLEKPYGKAVDWWALGTLLYEMLTGVCPFHADDLEGLYQNILYSDPKCSDTWSPECCDLLRRLLHKEPSQRLGCTQDNAMDIKGHPWFRDLDWEALYRREVEPPWVPPVESVTDTSQISNEFTSEPPVDTPVTRPAAAVSDQGDAFTGFTFVAGSQLGNA